MKYSLVRCTVSSFVWQKLCTLSYLPVTAFSSVVFSWNFMFLYNYFSLDNYMYMCVCVHAFYLYICWPFILHEDCLISQRTCGKFGLPNCQGNTNRNYIEILSNSTFRILIIPAGVDVRRKYPTLLLIRV